MHHWLEVETAAEPSPGESWEMEEVRRKPTSLGPNRKPSRHIQMETNYNWVVPLRPPCRVAGSVVRDPWPEDEVVMR